MCTRLHVCTQTLFSLLTQNLVPDARCFFWSLSHTVFPLLQTRVCTWTLQLTHHCGCFHSIRVPEKRHPHPTHSTRVVKTLLSPLSFCPSCPSLLLSLLSLCPSVPLSPSVLCPLSLLCPSPLSLCPLSSVLLSSVLCSLWRGRFGLHIVRVHRLHWTTEHDGGDEQHVGRHHGCEFNDEHDGGDEHNVWVTAVASSHDEPDCESNL